MRPYWGVSRYGRCRLFRLPVGLSVMGVAPISPLRAACAVHGVGRDLVAAGEGVPGSYCPAIFSALFRPTHPAFAAYGIMPFFKTVEAYTDVCFAAVRAGLELGAIHDVLPPPRPYGRPRASIVQVLNSSSRNSHHRAMRHRSRQFLGWGVFLRTPTKI